MGVGSLWLHLLAVVGGEGVKFKIFSFAPNDLKSPKKQHVFYYFFYKGGMGGWVKSLIENSINFLIEVDITLLSRSGQYNMISDNL